MNYLIQNARINKDLQFYFNVHRNQIMFFQ